MLVYREGHGISMTCGLLKPRNIEPLHICMSPLLAVTLDLVSPRQLVTLLQQTDSGTGALSNDLSRFRTGVELGSSGFFGIHGLVIYASIIAAAFMVDSWLITGTHFRSSHEVSLHVGISPFFSLKEL